MSKMGDLIVRLKLQYDDYKKGLKKASADTTSFGGTLGKIKGVGLAVWGAIGVAAVGFAKQLIKSSQTIGDAWNRTTAQMKAGWDVFVQSVGAWNWDNFIGRIKDATVAAKALTNALDAEFEVSNSIKLQKAAMAEELAELEVLARDQTKSYEERAEAAQKYLDKVKPLYDQELMLAQKLEDAHLGKFLAGSGLEDTAQVREELRKFLVDIGKIPTLLDDLAAKSSAQKTIDKGVNAFGSNYKKINVAYDVRNQMHNKLKDIQSGYQTDLVALFRAYNDMRGDEDAKPMVDAMIRAGEAAGAFNRETKRMQSALNSSLAQIAKETGAETPAAAPVVRETLALPALAPIVGKAEVLTPPQIFTDDWLAQQMAQGEEFSAWYQQMVERTAMMNQMLEDSIIQATTGGMQAFTDLLFGLEGADATDILAALLQPFANTATQLGSLLLAEGIGIKAFKESLKTLNPAVAIGAGVALIALGAALGSAIKALGTGGSGGASATNGGYSSGSSGSSAKYSPELTIKIQGKLRGSDIVMSEENTRQKWGR